MFSAAQFAAMTVLACAYAGSITIALTVLPRAPPCDRVYKVQPGDTCDGISAANNASTWQVAQANIGVIDAACDNLFAGEFICLGLAGEDCTTTYVVQSGDSCQAIADANSITFDDILANNGNIDEECSNIYPGEVLCVQG